MRIDSATLIAAVLTLAGVICFAWLAGAFESEVDYCRRFRAVNETAIGLCLKMGGRPELRPEVCNGVYLTLIGCKL